MTEKQFPDIGIVHFLKKKGCRRVILRVKTDGEVYVTMPWLYSQMLAEQFVRSSYDWILAQQQKKREHNYLITLDTELYTHFHSVEMVQGVDNSFRYSIQKDKVKILVPRSVKIENEHVQEALQNVMISVLRKEAMEFLPNRVEQLAKQHGFSFSSVSVSSAKTRWGCCTSQKRIRFSLFTMTLPFHLIDYVILHELCHTRYMNHSSEFYDLLNTSCGGNHKKYRAEMKSCTMNVFPKFERNETLFIVFP